MVRDTILYDRLGVQSDSTDKEIKKAYHKLSLKWHPDKNKSEEADLKFKEISEAYNILSDPEKRKMYDQIGVDMLKNGAEGPQFDPNDIFQQFMSQMGGSPFGGGFNPFGGGSPFGDNPSHNNNEDCNVELAVSLDEIYNEVEKTINYKQKNYCKKCNGNGTKSGKSSKCSSCNGTGKTVIVRQIGNMIQQMVRSCQECNGSGESVNNNDKCNECNGNKYHYKDKVFKFTLKKGLSEGNKISIRGEGHHFNNEKTNLNIFIKEKPHHTFTRNGNDLHMDLNIRLYQLLFGFKKVIKHLDGRELLVILDKIKINSFSDDIVYIIKNEGMYDMNNNRGNIVVKINIEPIDLTKLEDTELTVLKKLLVKLDIEEYKRETHITNNQNNYIKTKLKRYEQSNNNYNRDYNRDYNEGGPSQCAHQ